MGKTLSHLLFTLNDVAHSHSLRDLAILGLMRAYLLLLVLSLLVDLLFKLNDSCLDPRVLESLLWSHSLLRLPFEALVYEFYEQIVVRLHHLRQTLCVLDSNPAFGVWILERAVVVVEEDLPPGRHDDHGPWRSSLDFHNALYLFFLVFASKDWEADVELVEDASKRPHVDGGRVSDSHHDLRSSIESTLDVSVKLFSFIGSTAEVDHLDATLVRLPQENVLRLHVAVDDVVFFHVVQRHQQLDCEPPDEPSGHSLEVVALDKLVQVHAQHLEGQDQVLPEHELLLDSNDVLLVFWVVVFQLL